MKLGCAVSFEGISCSGKSSIISELRTRLPREGVQTVVKSDLLKYKGLAVGKKIKAILDGGASPNFRLGLPMTETLLILAKRAFESQTRLQPAVSSGMLLLCDRDIDTVCAYQLPVLRDACPGVSVEEFVGWLRQTNSYGSVEPSRTYYLDVTAANSYRRSVNRTDRPGPGNRAQYVAEHEELLAYFKTVLDIPIRGRTIVRLDTNTHSMDECVGIVADDLVRWLGL